MDVVSKAVNWEFMNEPLYRWFIFFGCLMIIAWGWRGVLSFIPTGR
jgi:hypothetical protein